MKKILLGLSALTVSAGAVVPVVHAFAQEGGEGIEVTKTEYFTYTQDFSKLTPRVVGNQTILDLDAAAFNSKLTEIWKKWEGFGAVISVNSIQSAITNLNGIYASDTKYADVNTASQLISNRNGITMTSHQLVIDKDPNLTTGESNFYIKGDFNVNNNTSVNNVRLGSFARHNALSTENKNKLITSVFTNVFEINYTFIVSIEYTDKQNEFLDFEVPVNDVPYYDPYQMLSLLNGDSEFGAPFQTKIKNYILEKTNFSVDTIHFYSIYSSKYDQTTHEYSVDQFLGDVDTPGGGGVISETQNTLFYVGITSPDAGGVFKILLRYKIKSNKS